MPLVALVAGLETVVLRCAPHDLMRIADGCCVVSWAAALVGWFTRTRCFHHFCVGESVFVSCAACVALLALRVGSVVIVRVRVY